MNKQIGNEFFIYFGGSVIDIATKKEVGFIDNLVILRYLFEGNRYKRKHIVDFVAKASEEEVISFIIKEEY